MNDEAIPDGWVWECACGTLFCVVECALVRTLSEKPCDGCLAHVEGTNWDGDPFYGYVSKSLGWCGCGNPEEVDEWMRVYLQGRKDWRDNLPTTYVAPSDRDVLLAYIADERGWTEHGGSVGGAWLTESGERVLANLTAVLPAATPHTVTTRPFGIDGSVAECQTCDWRYESPIGDAAEHHARLHSAG